jgi:DNA-directed RNA polymerase alpha subunit/DNA-directed RNA polymerase subunit L
MSKFITEYSASTSKITNDNYVVSFNLSGVHQSLANAIRRICLAGIPIVAFDDTYHDNPEENGINIKKNVSALHNEFIAHRISLIPVCMYKNDSVKLRVVYDKESCGMLYEFKTPESVPTFILKIKNNDATRKELKIVNPDNNIDVTTNYMSIKNAEEFNPVEEFIIPDYVTGDYVLIHRIKPISTTEEVQDAEELDIEMSLSIGTGKDNARYNPTGTVSYEFMKDEPKVIEENFELYMENLQIQRDNDKLPRFNEKDIEQYRNSYKLLDAERIYKRNKYGEPQTIKFCVQSVGNLESKQIVYDALCILEIRSIILMNMFTWNNSSRTYTVNNTKISIVDNPKSHLIDISINNDDHTIGNLISNYLKKLFITDKLVGDYLQFAAYKMPHPLEERIVISIGLETGKDYTTLFSRFGMPLAVKNSDIAIGLMLLAISAYLNKLSLIKTDWTTVSGVSLSSFIIDDESLVKSDYDRRKAFQSIDI